MNILENIRSFFINILEWIKEAFNITPIETVDPEVTFLAKLETKGYTFDEDKNWYVRTWTTNKGAESILEVYQKTDGQWKQLMIGYGDRIFYEENV